MRQNKRFVIISPCNNEENNIKIFIKKINLLKKKNNYNLTILIVDDGSTDKTWKIINEEKKTIYNLRGIKLSRKFGKDSAIDAGINAAGNKYDFYIIIDSDLQHPIEKIPDLINKYKNGKYNIVTTNRIDSNEGFIREFFSTLFYKILQLTSEFRIISKTTDFMLISKNARKEYLKFNEKNKNFRATISWLGLKMTSIPININLRKYDKSKFNFFNLLKLGINILSSFSILPIKIVAYVGLIMSAISISILLFFILNLIIEYTIISWQTYFILIQIFLIGLCMISIGLLGLYLVKILDNTNNRPNYIIEKEI